MWFSGELPIFVSSPLSGSLPVGTARLLLTRGKQNLHNSVTTWNVDPHKELLSLCICRKEKGAEEGSLRINDEKQTASQINVRQQIKKVQAEKSETTDHNKKLENK